MTGERPPITAYEWLENVAKRGGDDAEWAHRILQFHRVRGGRYLKELTL